MCANRRIIFRVVEILLCIIGTVIYELTESFFSRMVSEGLAIGLGGYILILLICLISSRLETLPYCMEIMFLGVGFILNFFCGFMMIVTYSLKKRASSDLPVREVEQNKLDAALGAISIIVSMVMLIDLLSGIIICGNHSDEE